jgi:hypothetical protein
MELNTPAPSCHQFRKYCATIPKQSCHEKKGNNGSRKIIELEVNECNGGCCINLVEMGDKTILRVLFKNLI